GLDVIELVHVVAMVEQDFTVRIVYDTFLDHGRLDDVVHFLRYHDSFTAELSDRFKQVLDILRHAFLGVSLPRFLHLYDFTLPFEPAHLVDKDFHNDDGHDGKENLMVFNRINLKHNKAFGKQVKLLVGVEQIIVFTSFVVGFQYI